MHSCVSNMADSENFMSTVEKLKNSENYDMWKFQLEINLKSENLFNVVSGVEVLDKNATAQEKSAWVLKDAKAQRIIVATLENQVKIHVTSCVTSCEMYVKLKSLYETKTGQQKCKILQELFSLTYKENEDIANHISRIQSLAFKLRTVGEFVEDEWIMAKILGTLPERYNHFHSAWDSTSEQEKTLEKLISRLLAEEQRMTNSNTEPEVNKVAFKTGVKCFKCNKDGHIAKNCKTLRDITCFKCSKKGHKMSECKNNIQKKCRICKKENHIETECYFRKRKENNNGRATFLVENENKNLCQGLTFVIDSGTTSHMVNSSEYLRNVKEIKDYITVANKKATKMEAKIVGKLETNKCILSEVMYVPDLSKNLLSVNAITNKGYSVLFKEHEVDILEERRLVLKGYKNKNNGLYEINLSSEIESNYVDYEQKLMMWHKKLGHLNIEYIKKLKTMVHGLDISDREFKLREECSVCIKAKQKRESFKNDRKRAMRPLELIHTDVCGPLETTTWDGFKYFVTFLDDYTHYVQVTLIKSKYEVYNALRNFVNESENKWNLKVSKIRCDNGGEYKNSMMTKWTREKGIILDYTTPYTPQLNGKAERLNRTLMERVRALLLETEMDKEMWGEALYVAAYLLNRSPTSDMKVTPAELWHGKRPNLSRIHVFGAKAYVKRFDYVKKLENRSKEYVFVGYSLNGYRLWDSKNRKIIASRDVIVCDETIAKAGSEIKNRVTNNNWISLSPNTDSVKTNAEDESYDQPGPVRREEESSDIEEVEANESKKENHMEQTERSMEQENGQRVVTSRGREVKRPAYLHDYALLTYEEAINCKNKEIWLEAIEEEKKSLVNNETWEEIYMRMPKGFNVDNKVCKLKKSLYGLKQAPMKWNEKFTTILNAFGLKETKAERCVFKNKRGTLILVLYVDDGIVIGESAIEIRRLTNKLSMEFEMKIFTNLRSFIGMEIENTENEVKLMQTAYIKETIKKYQMSDSKIVSTPVIQIKESTNLNETDEAAEIKFPYREAVGSLLYAANRTRPDIAFAVGIESRHVENTSKNDVINLKRTLRYLKGASNLGISYKKNTDMTILEAYSDSDYAGDTQTRRSTTGLVIMYCGGPVSWTSRRQSMVTLSSTEAEFIAAAECTKELIYLKELICELTGETLKINLNIDNQSTIHIIKNGITNKRSRHIDIRYKYVIEKVRNNDLEVKYCPSETQLADILTKPLSKERFRYLRDEIMIVS